MLSHVGSFTNIRGGDVYPGLIRKTEHKPIRVFLQDGSNDLDNMFGNWPLAAQSMATALEYSKYDYKFVYGTGHHSGKSTAAPSCPTRCGGCGGTRIIIMNSPQRSQRTQRKMHVVFSLCPL